MRSCSHQHYAYILSRQLGYVQVGGHPLREKTQYDMAVFGALEHVWATVMSCLFTKLL